MRKCKLEECNNKYYAKGYCIKHYRRWQRHDDPYAVKYCSGKDHPNYNQHLPKETREKISKALTGRKFSKEHRRNISKARQEYERTHERELERYQLYCSWCGQPIKRNPYDTFNYEHHFCTRHCLGKWNYHNSLKFHLHCKSGPANPNWHGGKSFEPYSYRFNKTLKNNVRKRDNWTCQLCGQERTKQEPLTCHHIDYNKSNIKLSNLITLCYKCNSKANYNRSYWEQHFTKLMQDKYQDASEQLLLF